MYLSANNTGLNAAANAVNSGKNINAPAGVKTTAQAANEALTAKAGTSSGMGQKDFLTLFTTQLKCQDPLDPVKNEAFVAQLAQFSQLEATTSMADTLKAYVLQAWPNPQPCTDSNGKIPCVWLHTFKPLLA